MLLYHAYNFKSYITVKHPTFMSNAVYRKLSIFF